MTPQSEQRIQTLEDKIDALTKSVEDLVIAWNTAKGMTSFVKWLASVATAAVILYNLWVHGGTK